MRRPRSLKWRVVKKIFRSFGIAAVEGKSSGHRRRRHAMLVAEDGKRYPIPAKADGDDIFRTYTEAARRAFGLTPEDGVTDEDFYGRA